MKTKWEKNGPNYYATIDGVECFVGHNDVSGRYHLMFDNKDCGNTWSTAKEAKEAAEEILS